MPGKCRNKYSLSSLWASSHSALEKQVINKLVFIQIKTLDEYLQYIISSELCELSVNCKCNMLLLLLKPVEFDDDVALLLGVAGLVVGPQVTSDSEIGGTDSAAHPGPVFGFVEAV